MLSNINKNRQNVLGNIQIQGNNFSLSCKFNPPKKIPVNIFKGKETNKPLLGNVTPNWSKLQLYNKLNVFYNFSLTWLLKLLFFLLFPLKHIKYKINHVLLYTSIICHQIDSIRLQNLSLKISSHCLWYCFVQYEWFGGENFDDIEQIKKKKEKSSRSTWNSLGQWINGQARRKKAKELNWA